MEVKGLKLTQPDETITDRHDQLANRMNGLCCLNHLIATMKHGIKHQMYDYERRIYDELKPLSDNTDNIITRQQHKHLAIIIGIDKQWCDSLEVRLPQLFNRLEWFACISIHYKTSPI